MSENQQNKALQAFRDQIDKVDTKLISLLEERMKIVVEVAEFKKNNQEKFFIKSAREADMLKELVKKAGAHFSKETVVSIWRKIIAAANMREQPLKIAIHNPKNLSDYDYLVREHYSPEVPLTRFDSANNVVLELEKGEAQIGIFALPQVEIDEKREDAKENWWVSLANNRKGLRVFAIIPFVESTNAEQNRNRIKLVAVAAKEPEKSSDDNSLLYIEAAKEISKTQILSALKEQGLAAKILKSVKIEQVEGIMFHLAELDGFYLEDDIAIKNFAKSKLKPFAKILGHYAKAIVS